ncbi:MAG TPA: hypothetical protein VNK70_01025 [Candidatus Paceibacterota bacterium]|nr:hypothetical protein [Candidatus Paceibacterota bacterium]
MRGNKSTLILIVVLAAVVVGLFSLSRILSGSSGGYSSNVPCLVPNIPLVQHIHPHLTILVDGLEEKVPANIGLSSCERAIHTHDETGEIHVEAQDRREYTLGDFMDVWGKAIERPGYRLQVEVDGKAAYDPSTIVLKDKEQIVLKYASERPILK